MIGKRLAPAILIACILGVDSTPAQQPALRAVRTPTPGVWRNGVFIGFVPEHHKLELQRQADRPSSNGNVVRASNIASDGSTTAQASYLDESPTGEMILPEYGIPDDDGTVLYPDGGQMVDPCCHIPAVWVRAEYLYWSTKGMNVPALATTSPVGATQDQAGVLGQPGTRILFGQGDVNDDWRSGGRFAVGLWLDPEHANGIDFQYTMLEDETESFRGSNNTAAILARPFFNTQLAAQDARLIAFPGLVSGSLDIATKTEFQTFEVYAKRAAIRSSGSQSEFLLGYRYAELKDLVAVNESTLSLSGPTLDTRFNLFDGFDTENEFNGGQLGYRYLGMTSGCWSLELTAKVALGNNRSRAVVRGQTVTTTSTGDSTTTPSGLLTQASNVGVYEDDTFSTLSEFGVSLRRQFNCGWTATFGYNYLYWTEVLRAGEQIDTRINPTQIPPGALNGPPLPAFPFDRSDFWAQGLHLGLEYLF